MCINSSIMDF